MFVVQFVSEIFVYNGEGFYESLWESGEVSGGA